MTVAGLRTEYTRGGLLETDLDPDPIRQFAAWFAAAQDARVPEPNAMALATASPDGVPSARMVLLKGFDERGFVFYTNYESQKGGNLSENPRAALLFFWEPLQRQVRITGPVARLTREESAAYFHSRPVGSQLGALASHQSRVVPNREALEAAYARLAAEYESAEIPLPDYWGGYRVVPETIEFWQGRPNRLHDRLRYVRQPDGPWRIERLAP